MEIKKFIYDIIVIVLAISIGAVYREYVSELFEKDRHFSHLSENEREMSFRTEMGLYYYYYKIIVEAPNWSEGIAQLRNDTRSQYPKKIDAEREYNLLPEVVIGFLYHQANAFNLLDSPECWQIKRGEGLSTIRSCQGLAVPSYFYLEFIWLFAAITAGMLFIYATYLSHSIIGGLITVICFLFNHTECTRVQWSPPLRENFAYPIILSQMCLVTMILKNNKRYFTIPFHLHEARNILPFIGTVLLTTLSLGCWQFSQFILLTQIISLLILQWLKIIPRWLTCFIMTAHSLSLFIYQSIGYTNITNIYLSLVFSVISSYFLSTILKVDLRPRMLLVIAEIIGPIIITYFINLLLFMTSDGYFYGNNYSHVYDILMAKFTNYKDFHTLLYTCSATFDFLPYETYEVIIKTFLLPTAILSGFTAVYYWYRNFKIVNYPQCIEACVAYNALQTGIFIIMAMMIMRLKLLMNPHLCIIASLVANKKYMLSRRLKNELLHYALIILLVAKMSHKGTERIHEQIHHYGEYSNIEQEELFEWIKAYTTKNAVFAGRMSVTANLLLSTRRPIVNNPFYESKEMRERTLAVYEMYGRKDVVTVYETLKNMHVEYLVLDHGWCYSGYAKTGCRMIDIWDVADGGRAKRLGKRPLCPLLHIGNCHPFKRVFSNNHYVVLSLDYSTLIELKPATPLLLQS